jgi:HPt (histidine-containing phosphotransfer) domain-containing protein
MPEGLLLMQFPEVYSEEEIVYNGETFNLAAPDLVEKFQASAKWTIIEAPWAGSTRPVAAVKNSDDGAGSSMVLFLSMFSTATGKRWIRAVGTQNMDTRREALRLIIEAARKNLGRIKIKPNENNDDARIREANSSFTAVKTLGVAALGAVEAELKDAKKRLPKMQETIDNAQQALIKALRDEQDLQEKVSLLDNNREGRIMAGLTTAFAAMDNIQNLRGVVRCEFRQYRNKTALYIETKDLVVKANASGTDRRHVKGLKFYLMMGRDVYDCIHFDDEGCPTRTVHPHVMNGNRVCWGRAALPISEACGRNDWVSAVNIVIRWALQYSHNDHHTHTDFPKTDKAAGWVE